ncbi:hypothetical protein L596_023352 [Steinernema carpocapsae]|uniref:ABC transporter domain-containing protein n=1 Tax=Steinernema carpocapsae TaxID=34508 RepID=A0A4U5MDD9_STECR|nr:hypothetical protein L596_023352 [Steinernema carpocapsae]
MALLIWAEAIKIVDTPDDPYSFWALMANCINFDFVLSHGAELMANHENCDGGLKWSTIWKQVSCRYFDDPQNQSIPEQPTIGHLFIMLAIDALILIVITWYVEAVNPGGEGVPQKPWFFVLVRNGLASLTELILVQPSYWFPQCATQKRQEMGSISDRPTEKSYAKIEVEPANVKATIKVVNLCKTYGTNCFKKLFDCKFGKTGEKKAVDHLNLNMYHGQITALLGHNGAGKSTTFSMLTGVTGPSSGTAFIDGYDIRTSLPQIRKSLGLCPQYNILFDNLTVMEHLEFFCKLKGRPYFESEAMDIITRLKIDFKKDCYAGTLSGGQKRKLSLSIALIGGSEIVMLDEPTSGMDPGARHETWTLLQAEKANRSMLLTTHYMEEADLLGDRIAIMAHGQLQCCGSGMYLKNEYGAGYHLTVVYKRFKDQNGQDLFAQHFGPSTLDVLKRFSPNVAMHSCVGQEATFLLPASDRSRFAGMFKSLEQKQAQLNINSFGVSITTMEEVFLKVGDLANERMKIFNEDDDLPESTEKIADDDTHIKLLRADRRLAGNAYYLQHAKAMFIKRAIYFYRRWTQFIPQLLIPFLIMIGISVCETKLATPEQEYYSDRPYSDPYGGGNQMFQSVSPYGGEMSTQGQGSWTTPSIYEDSFTKEPQPLTKPPYYDDPTMPTPRDYIEIPTGDPGIIFLLSCGLVVSMALVVAGYANFLIRERKKKSKHMQMLSGLRPWMYWLTAFGWDVGCYLLTTVCFMIIYLAVDVKPWVGRGESIGVLILSMLLFAWTVIPFVYTFQFAFNSAAKGHTMIVVYLSITGLIGAIAVPSIRLSQIDPSKKSDTAYIWSIVFSWFFPVYNLSNCFITVYSNEVARRACLTISKKSGYTCSTLFNAAYFEPSCCGNDSQRKFVNNVLAHTSEKGILIGIIFFMIQGFIFWFTTIALENGWFSKMCVRKEKPQTKTAKNGHINLAFNTNNLQQKSVEDSDVLEEKRLVQNMTAQSHTIIVDKLTKWYGSFNAVKGVSFHVDIRDCFGLLGVNGAGKTSTFQMLTGENAISEGDALINGYSTKSDWRRAGAHAGYCPQYDAIIKEMSGEETLYMFARLRGIYEEDIPRIVYAVIQAIGIGMYAKRQIKTYSGGNKRRLSLGIAPRLESIPRPGVSSGIFSQRDANLTTLVREQGTALVLTSHSMEECEALCTSLAIMVHGQFRCFGSVQHLKNRYGAGYTLLIRLQDVDAAENAKREILCRFPGSMLKEEHVLQLNFELKKSNNVTWSSLFSQMEQIVGPLRIADYSLSQTTLEQIFVEFSRDTPIVDHHEMVQKEELLTRRTPMNGLNRDMNSWI